jgi:hypothetical protein
MPPTVLIAGMRAGRVQFDADTFGVPVVGRDEPVTVATVVVIDDEADRAHGQEEEDCRCHGTNYAPVDIPPTVAVLTLLDKILPGMLGACCEPSPSS